MGPRWLTAFLDFPSHTFDRGIGFWQAVTGYGLSPWRGVGCQFATLVPTVGDAYLRVQDVGVTGPRVHLDLHTDSEAELVARALVLGAVELAISDVAVLSSPGGMIFCVVAHEGETDRPPAARWPGGQRSIVDQVCLDIPPARYDEEVSFWAALTGWAHYDTDLGEFERLSGVGAVQMLVQRLDSDQETVAAHLDFACDDVAAEVARHLSLGARHVHDGKGWVTLADPTGLVYCITSRGVSSSVQQIGPLPR